MTVHFYMRGGHIVSAKNVENVEVDTKDGTYTRYKIDWKTPQDKPKLFSLSLVNIVAVVAEE